MRRARSWPVSVPVRTSRSSTRCGGRAGQRSRPIPAQGHPSKPPTPPGADRTERADPRLYAPADGGAVANPARAAMPAVTCPSCGRGSPADAAFCSGCGTKLGPNTAERESRKVVTALFCDLVGSTSLAELHDPEVLRPLLVRYFAEAREAVEGHGGRVEKF